MTEEFESTTDTEPQASDGTDDNMSVSPMDGINGIRGCLADTLQQQTAEQDAEIESAKVFLRQLLSEEDWKQVEEACVQNPRGFLVFRDLIENRNPTTFNTLLSASPVYRESDEIFEVFEEFARSGIAPNGNNEQATEARARATNSIIFLAKTRLFHLGDPMVFKLLADIARKIDITEFLPSLYAADKNTWSILLVCINASHKARMHDAETAFLKWFNASRTTLLSR